MAFYILPQKFKMPLILSAALIGQSIRPKIKARSVVTFFILLCCFVVCVGLVMKLGADGCKINDFLGEKGGVDEKRRDFKDF